MTSPMLVTFVILNVRWRIRKFSNMLEASVTADGHLEMPLPFRDKDPMLLNNRYVAEKSLECLKRRLLKDQAYRED